MRKYMKMAISFMAVMGIAAMAFAEPLPGTYVYVTNNMSPAFRIKYNGSAVTSTVTVTTNSIALLDDTVTCTVQITNTAKYVLSDLRAATNLAGKMNWSVEYLCALPNDAITGNVYAASAASLADGQWHEVGLINTARQLQWNACSYGDNVPERWLTSVYGYPLGTGDATMTVYVDQGAGYVECDKWFQTSPIYVNASMDGTLTNNVTTADATVVLNRTYSKDMVYGLRIPQKAKCLVRAARATTASSGGSLGATFTVK